MTGQQDWAAPDDRPEHRSTWPPPPAQPPAAAPGGAAPGWQGAPGWGGPPPPPPQGWQGAPGWGGPPPPPPQGGQGGGPTGAWGPGPAPENKPGVVPLRPLGLGELLDGAVTLVRRYPKPTLGLSAALALVTTLLNIPVLLTLSDSTLFDPTSSAATGSTADLEAALGELLAVGSLSFLLSFLSGVVLAGVITSVVGKGVLGEPMTLGQAWTSVRPLLLRLLGLAVVVLLIVYGVFVLAVAAAVALGAAAGGPGIALGILLGLAVAVLSVYLYVRLALAPSVMVLERSSIRTSLRRSAALVKGDWWRVFGILLLVLVITSFISQVVQTPFSFRSFTASFSGESVEFGTADVLLQSVGAAIALTVVAPFGAAVRALLYVDRRMRAEGLDVALAAASVPSSSPST